MSKGDSQYSRGYPHTHTQKLSFLQPPKNPFLLMKSFCKSSLYRFSGIAIAEFYSLRLEVSGGGESKQSSS